MASYVFAVPILPGQEEADRQFIAEIQGPRKADYEATWRRFGVRAEQLWYQLTPQGTLVIVRLELDDPAVLFGGLATSDDPYVTWFRGQIQQIHGLDLTQPLPGPPNELVHDWRDATSG